MRHHIAAALVGALAACSPSAPQPAPVSEAVTPPAAPGAKPAVAAEPTAEDFSVRYAAAVAAATADTSTPEAALRSWWAASEAMLKLSCEAAPYSFKVDEPWMEAWLQAGEARNKATLTGEAEAWYRSIVEKQRKKTCISRTFDHAIESTKKSGEGKVVIVAATHNATPLPDGMKLDRFGTQRRRDGSRFRYTLLKVDDTWRIASIEENPFFSGWSSRTSTTFQLENIPYTETMP